MQVDEKLYTASELPALVQCAYRDSKMSLDELLEATGLRKDEIDRALNESYPGQKMLKARRRIVYACLGKHLNGPYYRLSSGSK